MKNVETSYPSILFNYDGKGNSVMYHQGVDGEVKVTEFDKEWTEGFHKSMRMIFVDY